MPTFPSDPPPSYGYESWHEELLSRSEARQPLEQIRDVWGTTRFRAAMRFAGKMDRVLNITEFWLANRTNTFEFFDVDKDVADGALVHRNDTGAIVRTAVAAMTTYALPGKNVESLVVRVNGAVVANYTVTAGAGIGGRDRLVFDVAPTTGHTIDVDFRGYRSYNCKFAGFPRKIRTGFQSHAYEVQLVEDIEERVNAT